MKKIYSTLILLSIVIVAFSKTGKDSWILWGNIDFTSTPTTINGQYGSQLNATLFTLNPMIGFCPVRNF